MLPSNPNPRAALALKSAAAAALDDGLVKTLLSSPALAQPRRPVAVPAAAPHGAAPRNAAQHSSAPIAKPNPPRPAPNGRNPRPLKPIQLTGARLLLAGEPIGAIAAQLGVHRYTVTR